MIGCLSYRAVANGKQVLSKSTDGGSSPSRPATFAAVAQPVEHLLGKEKVACSIHVRSFITCLYGRTLFSASYPGLCSHVLCEKLYLFSHGNSDQKTNQNAFQ